jgi:hypothetical protein
VSGKTIVGNLFVISPLYSVDGGGPKHNTQLLKLFFKLVRLRTKFAKVNLREMNGEMMAL